MKNLQRSYSPYFMDKVLQEKHTHCLRTVAKVQRDEESEFPREFLFSTTLWDAMARLDGGDQR